MEGNSQFTNCSSLTIDRLKRANTIIVTFCAVSLLLLLLFLAFLVLYRAYRTTLQRLFLYLTIATALDFMVATLNIELQFDVTPKFCAWIAFGDVWTTSVIELFHFCFTAYLIATAYQKIRGRQIQCLGGCRRHPVLTEIICTTAIIFLLPLSYLWVPIYHHTYGLDGAVCWVKKIDRHCNKVKHYDVDSIPPLRAFNLFYV